MVKKMLQKSMKNICAKACRFQTFALPLSSLSGFNAAMLNESKMILETIPYRQAVQRSLFEKLNKE